MSKSRRMIAGFLLGLMEGMKENWQMKRAQEAEALREARLAAIRAEERGYQNERDAKLMEERKEERVETRTFRAEDREDRQAEAKAAREEMAKDRLAQIAASRAAAEAGAGAGRAPPMMTIKLPDGTQKYIAAPDIEKYPGAETIAWHDAYGRTERNVRGQASPDEEPAPPQYEEPVALSDNARPSAPPPGIARPGAAQTSAAGEKNYWIRPKGGGPAYLGTKEEFLVRYGQGG